MYKDFEKIKNKTVLVTGGLGFVGHNLVKYLVEELSCKVIVVDDCSNSSPKILEDTFDKIEFHQISVIDTEKLFPLIERANFVFHLACKQISASGKEPLLDLQVNAQSTLQMLEYIKSKQPKNLERFVYTSSCSVYGSQKNLPAIEEGATKVLSNYAATKLLGENYVNIYANQYGIPASCVRYSNVFGTGQTPTNPYCGVLGIFVHNALIGKPLTVIGDGEQTRDYTYIDDTVKATILAATHPRAEGDVFNVGTSIETSVNKLAEIISGFVQGAEISYIPERDIDNIRRRSVDIERIHRRLGWTPQYNVKRGLEKTIVWYEHFLNTK